MVRGRAEKKTIKTKHGRGAIKDRKKNGDILAVCGKVKSIISAASLFGRGRHSRLCIVNLADFEVGCHF